MTHLHGVVDYLVRHGYLAPADVVDRAIHVVDASRRNTSVMVIRENGTGYVVKRGDRGEFDAVAHEARVYELLASAPTGDRPPIPRLAGWDTDERVLVVDVEPGARSLRAFHAETKSFPAHIASATGDALARLHRLDEHLVHDAARVEVPRVLSIHRLSPDDYSNLSRACLDLVGIVQQSTVLGGGLDALRAGWQATAFIHGDLKWGNCVVFPADGDDHVSELHVVDWETAGFGDPCWDTGSVFGEYLTAWVTAMPVIDGAPSARDGMPLERIQPATRAFWSAYLRASGMTADSAVESLLRSARYAAARLVQTAVEQAQGMAGLDGRAIVLLQLAENMMSQPERAVSMLLGIDQHSPDAT
jgi:aminoglycoside phosphotransferase (APT) family kinase protein